MASTKWLIGLKPVFRAKLKAITNATPYNDPHKCAE
jgi:hypothetical protein